jgi:hypothetical protein
MWATVNTPKQGSEVALGVELGRLEAPEPEVVLLEDVEIDEIEAIAANLVEITFVDAVDAEAAMYVENYVIVEKHDADAELSVVGVVEAGEVADEVVVVEVEEMAIGTAYTLTVAGEKANFTGIEKDNDDPVVDSVKGSDTNEVTVAFKDALVDKATAEDVANYSIDKDGVVVAAKLNDDRDEVKLTVKGLERATTRKLTVENVMSTDGVEMKSTTKSFAPKFDTKAPKLDKVDGSEENNTEVLINWDDVHGVDKETAEDISNYEIEGLEILSAKATYQDEDEDDYYDRVILTTSPQKRSKSYELKVLYMVDGSTAANATTDVLKEDFRGQSEDDNAPTLKSIEFVTFTEVKVIIEEDNALDMSTALDTSNFWFDDDELDVLEVEFYDLDDNGNDYFDYPDQPERFEDKDEIELKLTVSEADEDERYKLYVDNLSDEFGNVMEDDEYETDRTGEEVKTAPVIAQITSIDLDTIKVEFDEETGTLVEDLAEDATNYMIDGGIGAATEAELDDDDLTVILEVPEMTEGKTYELTVNNVENFWGYACEDETLKFVATDDADDTSNPSVEDVDYDNKGELVVTFDEAM